MFYITGDMHRDFGRIVDFCARINPAPEDVMIILGDAGIKDLCINNSYRMRRMNSSAQGGGGRRAGAR